MSKAAAAILFAFAAGCTVGSVPPSGSAPDSSVGDVGSGGGPPACVDRATPTVMHTHAADGTDNKGMHCINVGCHASGQPGGEFGAAGTIYMTDGVTGQGGATVIFQPPSGPAQSAITDPDGDFYIFASALTDTTGGQFYVTACPTITPMTDISAAGGGDCFSCHTPTGAAGAVVSF